jgi:alkylglycerol monooxygenase
MNDSSVPSSSQRFGSAQDKRYLLATTIVLCCSVAVLALSWRYLSDLYAGPPYALFVAFLVAEIIRSKRSSLKYFSFNSTMDNILLGAFHRTLLFVHPLYSWGLYLLVFSQFRLLEIEAQSVWAIISAVICYDFAFYWAHRCSHRINFLWAAHVVHHQSEEFNLSVAFRESCFQYSFFFLFYLSLALIGFTPGQFIVAALIHGIWQFLTHSRVSKSMGPIELVFITPSLHGLHHAVNDKYLDKNFGAFFSIWDQLFGTFVRQDPSVTPRYGIVRQMNSWNPVSAVFTPWIELFRLSMQTRSFADLLRVWFGTPEFLYAKLGDLPDAPRKKKPVSWPVNLYVLAQLLPAGLATYALFQFGYTMPVIGRIALFAIVAVSFFGIGLLLDQSTWARRFETLRQCLLAISGIMASAYFSTILVTQSQWPSIPYLTSLFCLCFCGYSLYYIRTSAHLNGSSV